MKMSAMGCHCTGSGLMMAELWTPPQGVPPQPSGLRQRGIPVSPHDRSFGERRRGPSVSAGQFIADPPSEHNESASPLIADMRADIDLRRYGPIATQFDVRSHVGN